MRGHIKKRGTWQFVVDLGLQPLQRCPPCHKRILHGWCAASAGRAAGAAGRPCEPRTIPVEPPLPSPPPRRSRGLTLAHTRTLRRARMPLVRWALAEKPPQLNIDTRSSIAAGAR